MRKAVIFEDFAYQCPYFVGDTEINNGYGCEHPEKAKEPEEVIGSCYCFACPLGTEAEQEDRNCKSVDWDGLCEDGEVEEAEYLLVRVNDDADEDEKKALRAYELYMHRYDKKWLDAQGIPNQLCQ